MILSILIVIVTLGLTFYHCVTHYGRMGKLVNKIPGPTAHPLLGNVWEFMVPLNELWVVLRKIHTKYYPINRIWLGVMPTVSVYHPDDVQIVLSSTKHTEKSQIYSFLHPWLGRGLLTSTGAKWQARRKMLTPAFHFNILQEFVDVFVEQSEVFVRDLKSDGDEVIKDIIPLLTKFTLDSICGYHLPATKISLGSGNGTHYTRYRFPRTWGYETSPAVNCFYSFVAKVIDNSFVPQLRAR